MQVLKENTYVPSRAICGPFIFSVDHCFSIKGQGTVMTGTALSGKVAVNDTVEISALQVRAGPLGRIILVFFNCLVFREVLKRQA